MIRVTGTALNAGRLAAKCIVSVRSQTFDDWTLDYFDAKSDDDTYTVALEAAAGDPRIRIHRNETRQTIFGNLLPLWRSFADDDVVIWLDGDDELACPEALETVLAAHKNGALVTYGQFRWANGLPGIAAQVGPDPRSEEWRASHLKSFRAGLINHIKDNDLKNAKGEFSNFVTDLSIMLPLLEMVPNHSVFIPKVLHIYHSEHNAEKLSAQDLAAHNIELHRILGQQRYTPLRSFMSQSLMQTPIDTSKPIISDTGFWDGRTAHLHHGCSASLAAWIADYLKADKDTPTYDFGCGVGAYLEVLQVNGFQNLLGFEGDPPKVRRFQNIKQHDLTKPLVIPEENRGNVICLEVAEHIPPEFEDVFLDNVTNACKEGGKLILSWAIRGQGGDGHVNCLDNHEAIERITRRGFKLLVGDGRRARSVITDLPWFANTTLVFKKCSTRTGRKIPKIIHQIWIGPFPPPEKLMNTWKDKHPASEGWEYKVWRSEQGWENQVQIDAMPEWAGKADIMRYEILERFGGVFVDADSECVQKLDDSFLEHEAFACWANELVDGWLIANGYIGSAPHTALMRTCIARIGQISIFVGRAWESVGPKLFTKVAENFPIHIFPARTFIPKHHTGVNAWGDFPIYANQFWGSTFGYDKINQLQSQFSLAASNQMRILYADCPLCSSSSFALLRESNCTGHPLYNARLPTTMRWMQCSDCAHVFVDGYFTDEAFAIIFQRANAHQIPTWNHDNATRLLSARMVTSVARLRTQLGGRWLDVGFGNGLLMTTASEFGFDVTGIDLRPAPVHAMVALGFHAECVDLTAFEALPFDVISMMDVLEHMPYPKAGLAAAHKLLADDGLLFLSMPNIDSFAWRSNDRDGTNPYWYELEHFHNFGRERLYALLVEHGFEPCSYGVNERYFLGMEVIARKIK